ncbi:MAG: DUF1232 domain-containing protein [Myxococcaceae bacterium]|nr:DUF1232 domain-containing protein [Myxococcaceae bacterium]MCI0674069.1 DUF1232 domain-containing protein [Myxococcaceae bacterium]
MPADTLFQKVTRAARSAGRHVIEKVLWLYYALEAPGTPAWAKSTIIGALAYFVLPVDAVPDFIPGAGYADDAGVLAAAVAVVALHIDAGVRRKAQQKMADLGLD